MGKHLLPRRDTPTDVRGICVACRERPQRPNGKGGFRSICRRCERARYPWQEGAAARRRQKLNRKGRTEPPRERCEQCGFVAEHPCQLDLAFRDGDRDNVAPENLMILCANCNRLRTYSAGDYRNEPFRAKAA